MAKLQQRRTENTTGDFYVDSSCIDCDTCRWVAPEIFQRVGEQSAVYHQPKNEAERLHSLQALLACPTASIGTVEKPQDIKAGQQSFPLLIEDNVYYCGYHSELSYGAASYFIQRKEGNVLVDSPRFTPPLVKQIEALGGVEYLYLTHQDDVADHQKWQKHFGCQRALHTDDVTSGTQEIEIKLSGTEASELAPDLLIIPVPGHTKGHTVLLSNQKFLFTGDHLAWSPYLEQLYAFRHFCWYSWSEQINSMEKLAKYNFEWVLPGHGRRYKGDRKTMTQQMQHCLQWMKNQK
jgi:glyoxylase-like metal-dependent hydrolase (beta-lactamase superfamily II)/ferredoxin